VSNESTQKLNFRVSTNNDALFAALPAVDATTGTLTYTPATFASGTATVTVVLGDDGGTANGGRDTSAPQTFTITVLETKFTPTVSVTDTGGAYNRSAFAASATVAGVVSGIDATLGPSLEGAGLTITYYVGLGTGGANLGGTAPTAAGTYTVMAVFPGSTHYLPASSQTTLIVGPAPLRVSALAASKTYGQADPAFSASYAGFVPGEGPGDLGGSLTFATNEPLTGYAPAGGYTITPGGLSSNNYAITFVAGTLTVSKAQSTMAGGVAADTSVFGQAVTCTVTVSAVDSGIEIGRAHV
jgi:large repetitive protein